MGAGNPRNETALREAKISHIVCIGGLCFCRVLKGSYKRYPVSDNQLLSLLDDVGPLRVWLKEGTNEGTLIHCGMGQNRSVALAIAYLMVERDFSYDAAYKLLESKRDIDLDSDYIGKLQALEEKLKRLSDKG